MFDRYIIICLCLCVRERKKARFIKRDRQQEKASCSVFPGIFVFNSVDLNKQETKLSDLNWEQYLSFGKIFISLVKCLQCLYFISCKPRPDISYSYRDPAVFSLTPANVCQILTMARRNCALTAATSPEISSSRLPREGDKNDHSCLKRE